MRYRHHGQRLSLETIPNSYPLVQPKRNHVTGRTRECHYRIVVGFNFVHTGAYEKLKEREDFHSKDYAFNTTSYQIPHAKETILTAGRAHTGLPLVDEQARYRPAVPVQRELQHVAVETEYLHGVVLAAGHDGAACHFQARYRHPVPLLVELQNTTELLLPCRGTSYLQHSQTSCRTRSNVG